MGRKSILTVPSAPRLTGEFASAREKLRLLNLDPVMELWEPYYPPFGRPAVNQTQILRSLVLMLDQGFTSITAWVKKLSSDTLLAFPIGCPPDLLPPRDFAFKNVYLFNFDFWNIGGIIILFFDKSHPEYL